MRTVNKEPGDRLRETEVPVSLVKDLYILKGHVDLIRGEGNTGGDCRFQVGTKTS